MSVFTNNVVDVATLPTAESLILVPVERSYKTVLKWEWMVRWGIISLVYAVVLVLVPPFRSLTTISIAAGSIFILAVFNLWAMHRSFAVKAYAVREKDIVYRSGWIVQRLSVCPFNRIQHCSVSSGPFERKLQLAALSVHTAGSDAADIKIPGLNQDTAVNLRDFIMNKAKADEQTGN